MVTMGAVLAEDLGVGGDLGGVVHLGWLLI
jgi:hypothetical protein